MAPACRLSVYDDEPFSGPAGGCCVLLPRRSFSLGYRPLVSDDVGGVGSPAAAVTVLVGKERREFLVDAQVLESDPFKVLLGMAGRRRAGIEDGRRSRKKGSGRGGPLFVGVDSIFFEHMLWLAENGAAASLPRRDLEEIIDFYSHEL